MSLLHEATKINTGLTLNGAVTHTSTTSNLLDFFFVAGSSRGKDISDIFFRALAEDEDKALRTLLWMRDVRGGAGERQQFKDLASKLPSEEIKRLIPKIAEVGRWDDLLAFVGTTAESEAVKAILNALEQGNGLVAKWMPRQDKKGAKPLRKAAGMNPKQWRKYLVEKTKVVEQDMCAKIWENIEFKHVPSLASARYQKAFTRNCGERYEEYKTALANGETTINAGAVYPYDVVKSLRMGDKVVADAQWKALPDYLQGSTENILPVVDVSGSMSAAVGGNPNLSCKDVAISLGLYLSERSKGVFKDEFVSFSSNPHFHHLSGSLSDRLQQMKRSGEDMSTNLLAVFDLLVSAAVQHKIPVEHMPTKLLILSDMEFDSCNRGYGRNNLDTPMMNKIKEVYNQNGYEVPQLVFWNLNARAGNFPVTKNNLGVAMVSGFSPSIMKSILGGKDFNPMQIMLDTIMVDRYKIEE